MLNLLFFLLLSPYTAIGVGGYITYKVYKERQRYIFKNRRLINSWNIGMLMLFVWSVIVGLINKSVISTLASASFLLYFCISVYIEAEVNTEELVNKIARQMLKFSVVAALFGFFEVYFLSTSSASLWRMYIGLPLGKLSEVRMSSTFMNPNVAGDWFAMMILICFYYQCRSKSKRERLQYAGMNIIFVLALILTGSRGAFGGLIAGLFTLFLLDGKKKNVVALLSIVAIVGIIGFMPNEVSAISTEITGHNIGRSFYTRSDIWKGAIEMTDQRPVTGWGLVGTLEYGWKFFKAGKIVNHAHNIWLSLSATLGFVGLGIYLFMRANVYRGLISMYREKSKLTPILAGLQILLIVHGIIDFTIITPQIGIMFMGTSSIILALSREEVRVRVVKPVVQSTFNGYNSF